MNIIIIIIIIIIILLFFLTCFSFWYQRRIGNDLIENSGLPATVTASEPQGMYLWNRYWHSDCYFYQFILFLMLYSA